jgi:hypothetical protein
VFFVVRSILCVTFLSGHNSHKENNLNADHVAAKHQSLIRKLFTKIKEAGNSGLFVSDHSRNYNLTNFVTLVVPLSVYPTTW